jgi:hypothetical protein
MGSFAQAFSKNKSVSQQQQQAQQSSAGGSSGFSSQDVFGAQQPALGQLYASAQGLLGQGPSQLMGQGTQALGDMLSPGVNPQFSAMLQQSIDQATQSFNRDVMGGLRADAVGAGEGNYGGPRDQLFRGQAAGEFGRGLLQSSTQAMGNEWGRMQAQRMQALGLMPQFQQMQWAPQLAAAGMIGGPTVLGQSGQQAWNTSQGTSSGWGGSTARGFSHSMSGSFGQ